MRHTETRMPVYSGVSRDEVLHDPRSRVGIVKPCRTQQLALSEPRRIVGGRRGSLSGVYRPCVSEDFQWKVLSFRKLAPHIFDFRPLSHVAEVDVAPRQDR